MRSLAFVLEEGDAQLLSQYISHSKTQIILHYFHNTCLYMKKEDLYFGCM